MNSDKLSARLEMVAKYVPKGASVADIGSDHAYLPCFLVKNFGIPFAVAGEVAEGPFQSAVRNVNAQGLSDVISVRTGDGLDVVGPDEVECITIAGMGGTLIASILEKGKDKLGSVKRLILQPNIHALSIRKWFLENNWELKAEEILEEDGKIYEILIGEKGDAKKPYGNNMDAGLLFGPYLSKSRSEAFFKKWSAEKKNWERIYTQLVHASETEEASVKKQELLMKIRLAEGVLVNEES
ncbi:tRNA (adenine-N(1))-methyltransferase [Bacillus sp. BRMEA1]|uniref:tRNA (adenine(22)-N(1))-methyltransferase n=1 Tax=Neobacillus endophyticus TaxID=2738405 RepID=UPI001565B9C0|nr:tRNA (adenine(22)-N(1))-methyltransferase TrmK [Neobacillus endophyticus]NRD80784.1 tRNA (adenine-N(1))-methyltransferase [Neobacillus endophyticus]